MALQLSSLENTRLKNLLRDFILRYKRDNPGKAINTKTLGDKIKEIWGLDRTKGQLPTHKLSSLRRFSPHLFAGIKVVESPHASFNLNTWSSHEGVRNSLKSFIDRFKKNNPREPIGSKTLANKVKEIWNLKNDLLSSKKLSSLRKYNPNIFAGLTILDSRITFSPPNELYQKDAKFREFFKDNFPKRKWKELTEEKGFKGRGLKKTAYEGYLKHIERKKVIPKNYIRLDAFAKEMGLNPDTLKSQRSSNTAVNKILEDLFDSKSFGRNEVYYKAPTEETKATFKKLHRDVILESRKGMVNKKQAAFTEPIKALYKELRIDPDATPRELSEAIYGNSKAATLRNIGNDASKLTEVLTGSRHLPGFKFPSMAVTQDILANILTPANSFFNYGNSERRQAMMRERDQILKTKGDKLAQLRVKLLAPGKHLDEAMSLSATYKRAPGYTELAQSIDPAVNMLKGNTIDLEFSRLFEKVITGKEGSGTFRGTKYNNLKEHINLFNKSSRDFQKMHGVDTPLIEYQPNKKLLAKDFVKNFKYLSPEAAVNVQELADKGIALKSKAMPMGKMVELLVNAVKKSPAGCRNLIAAKVGGSIATCTEIIKSDPVGSANKLANMEATSGALGKVKNAATTFLGTLGKFGARAAPLAALAAVGAAAEPLVKQFRNDDPSTYMTDVDQQKGVLLSLVESETPKVDEEILKWQMPALGAATVAGAVPGAGEVYKARRAIRPDKLIGPMEKGVGPARAALGIKGVLGKALGASFSPLAVAATLPMTIAAQKSGGTDYSDIATDPFNWMGPAFAASGADFATKGMKSTGILAKAIRMGMNPATLRAGSRFLGMPGLALSAGLTGYDWWKNRGKDKDDEFKVRTYKEDDE